VVAAIAVEAEMAARVEIAVSTPKFFIIFLLIG
jgi:hypothetical protein